MKKAIREKKLIKDAYTVENRSGKRYRIRPVLEGLIAADLTEWFYNATRDSPAILEDGSKVYYNGEWFIIRETGTAKITIATLTAI